MTHREQRRFGVVLIGASGTRRLEITQIEEFTCSRCGVEWRGYPDENGQCSPCSQDGDFKELDQ